MLVIFGWDLAARLWHAHLPDPLAGDATCATCHLPMPCPSWRFADALVVDAIEPATELRAVMDDATRELPRIERRPLPRREPGASLAMEERYDGWFTQ